MTLIETYQHLLFAADMLITEDGCVSLRTDNGHLPLTISKQRLCLPYEDRMRQTDWTDYVLFNPFAESLIVGESKVTERYRRVLFAAFNRFSLTAFEWLLKRAANDAEHKTLSPPQKKFLKIIDGTNERTVEVFQKIVKAGMKANQEKILMSGFIKKGGKVDNISYRAGTIVEFPLYEYLAKKEKPWGVTITETDRVRLMKLLEWMFPDIDKPAAYSRGSNCARAPFIDSLMASAKVLGERIDAVLDLYPETGIEHRFIGPWVNAISNIESFMPELRCLPKQGVEAPKTVAPLTAPIQTAAPGVATTTMQATAPAKDGGPISLQEMLRRRQMKAAPPPAPVSPVGTQVYGAQYGHVPVQPQMAQPHNPYLQQPQFQQPMQYAPARSTLAGSNQPGYMNLPTVGVSPVTPPWNSGFTSI